MTRKIIATLSTLLLFMFSTQTLCASTPRRIVGSRQMTTRTLPVPEYSQVAAARGVNVIIDRSDKQEIVISADDNLIDYVTAETENGTLTFSINENVKSLSRCTVEIFLPYNGNINLLSATSGADIHTKTLLRTDKMTLRAASSGKIATAVQSKSCNISAASSADINAAVHTTQCKISASSGADVNATIEGDDLSISGSSSADIRVKADLKSCVASTTSGSDLRLEGKCELTQLTASSGSTITADELISKNASATASSGADLLLHCTDKLTATASSGAEIKYTGNCSVNATRSSGGDVEKK